MAIFKLKNKKLTPIKKRGFDLEKDIQLLTEKNLNEIFDLTFVSGALNQEFSVKAFEQDFYIDTLALDESTNSPVIIEYKKEKNFHVIDQGFAYLSAMLNHKADFVLEINERLKKNFTKNDIDWEQSKVIFISPEYTNYQKNAINFKDLPIFLYEIKIYENDIVEFNDIKPYATSESITKLSKDKTISRVSKEVKVYNEDHLVKAEWNETRDLLHIFEQELMKGDIETKIKYTKYYIAYTSRRGKEWVNYVEVVPQKQGLKVYFRFQYNFVKTTLKLGDCSKVGHWTNGNSYVIIKSENQIQETVRLSKESYRYTQVKKK